VSGSIARRQPRLVAGSPCGPICLGKRNINFSQVFGGQNIGIKEVSDGVGSSSPSCTTTQKQIGSKGFGNPFEPKVLPLCPV
jgi:hypothetical protein